MTDPDLETNAKTPKAVDTKRFPWPLFALILLLGVTNGVTLWRWNLAAQQAPSSDPSLPTARERVIDYGIINAHDHLYREQDLDKYLEAAKQTGVTRTLFVASSDFTFKGDKFPANEGNEWSSREILKCAKKYPGKIIPFMTLHPDDENKVALLEEYVQEGAQGLKLYTGHSNFYDRPFLAEEMLPVYEFCERTGLILCWHINLGSYLDEFTKVLLRYPKLKVILPHFGVGFFQPGGKVMQDLAKIMDTYPDVYVDTSFGTREILVTGLERVTQNPQPFREFYAKYQDRIVWGTDMVITGNREKTTPWIASVILACRNLHEQEEYVFWMAAQGAPYNSNPRNTYGRFRGLNLDDAILKKIYKTNAERLFGTGS